MSTCRIGNDPVVARPHDQVRWSSTVVPLADATPCCDLFRISRACSLRGCTYFAGTTYAYPVFRAGGNHYALAVVALLRGVQVSPSLPWPSSPTGPRLPSRPGPHLVSAAAWRRLASLDMSGPRLVCRRGRG